MQRLTSTIPSTLLLAAGLLSGCASTAETAAPVEARAGAFIQFRLVDEGATARLDTQSFEGEILHLEPEVLAADPELARPRLVARDGAWTLDVRFTADGGVALDRALLDHPGRRVALLVESRVRYVVNVRPQLGASRLLVPLDISSGEATRLQETIRNRWPETAP